MTSFDYIVLSIVGFSVLVSMMRGFVKELLSLISWVAAFLIARFYTTELAPLLPKGIPSEGLRLFAAFIILFLSTLLVSSLLSIAVSQIFRKTGLNGLDRFLGAIFGILRGLLIVCVLVFLAGLTSLPKEPLWRDAMFSPPLEKLVTSALQWLPDSISKYVKYD